MLQGYSSPAFLTCFAALLISTACNVFSTIYNVELLNQLRPLSEKKYTYINDDYPAQLPVPIPTAALTLVSGRPHFALLADDEWGTLFPPSDGFLVLGPQNRTFLLSMYHQLHCLDVIRVGFVLNGTYAAHHIEHCLRYLRQIVLCHADTTLEVDEPEIVQGKWEHGSSGEGMVHRCRDWTRVRQFVVDRPSTDFEV